MTKTHEFIEKLNAHGIRYCHWKSNLSLSESLAGQLDVDLLVHREDAGQFRTILSQLAFEPASNKDGDDFPSVEHYFALDEESGVLAHVHAYFRVITGDSLTKNYRFPIEGMLLENTRMVGSMPVLSKSAELIVFTLRMMLKHTSVVELVLLARYWKQVKQEALWLLESDPMAEALQLLQCWLPSVSVRLFETCVDAIKTPAPLLGRILLGFRLRAQLRSYARHSAIRSSLIGMRIFAGMVIRRVTGSRKELMPRSGGAVIAFVGPEATGKSTLIGETHTWLGEHFAVEQVHAGKPRSTWLTMLPNLLVPALRSLFPSARSTRLEAQYLYDETSSEARSSFPLIFVIRSVLLAYDRRSLLGRVHRRAANGAIVLCDRYPSSQGGAPDSPQLSQLLSSTDRTSIRYRLAVLESRLYREIPPPDLVIYLTAPLEVALSRNSARGKREPEDYVRRRHARSSNLEFERTIVQRINTDRTLDETTLEIKRAIWGIL